MSRSFKKTSICGNANNSEKLDKRHLHHIKRANQRDTLNKILKNEIDGDDVLFDTDDEALDQWDMNKDGRYYFNENEHPKLMRK